MLSLSKQLLIACLVVTSQVHAQVPALLKDIRVGASNSNPGELTVIGNTVFFEADDNVNGSTLWKTDGTPEGTVMVVPPGMGTMPLSPLNLKAVGNLLYFAASSAAGRELWRSDGTVAGTYMVIDLNPGVAGGGAGSIFGINGTIFFSGSNGATGSELHKTDGTAAGTVLLKDINPGAVTSQIENMTNLDGTLIFSAASTVNASNQQTDFELWKSNGTPEGTVRIKDINPGVANGTVPGIAQAFPAMNGAVYFRATNTTNGLELWKTNGTEAGTVMVKDINPNAASSTPQYLHAHNGYVYFSALDPTNGNELWRSDGTADGTILLRNIYSGSTGSHPRNFYSLGDTLLFSASNSTAGSELWKTDGTNAGTVLVKDINPGSAGSNPMDFATFGDTAYFQANGGSAINYEIFKTDGTAAGTGLAAELVPGASGSYPEQLVIIGDKLIFVASTAATGAEIFVMPLSSSPALVTWTGNVSTFWEDPANWEPMQLPGSNSEVIIPSGRPRYPIVAANTQVRKLSCESGASVTVAEGISFTVLQ